VDDALVFYHTLGKPLHRSFLHKGLTEACTAAGLPRISLRGCRHTFAGIAIAAGEPVTHVSKLLGYKDPEFTLKRYSHRSASRCVATTRRTHRAPFSAGMVGRW